MNVRISQWIELGLWWAACFFWLMYFDREVSWWQPMSLWLLFYGLYRFISRDRAPANGLLLVATLAAIGWLFMARLSSSLVVEYWQSHMIAGGVFAVAYTINWSRCPYKYLYGTLTLLLLLITGVFGTEVSGARAWLSVGALRFQPIEIARVFLLLFLAGFFFDNHQLLQANKGWPILRYWGPIFVLMTGVLVFLAVQRDLGPALLFYCVFITLSLYTAFSWYSVGLYVLASGFGVVFAWFEFGHFRQRIWIWLDPWVHQHHAGYQVLQGLFSLNAGGLFGTGLTFGAGALIPAVHTDYIFALIGEEFGLLGASMVLLLYFMLLFWGLTIAKHQDGQDQLLAVGIVALWGFQVFLVVAGNLKILPLTGMTLPFLSYGGSSQIANMWLLGILISLGGQQRHE